MFVEGNVEIKIKDRPTIGFDEHELKIWVQSSFKTLACYRVSNFAKDSDKLLKVTVAIRTDHLGPDERQALEENPKRLRRPIQIYKRPEKYLRCSFAVPISLSKSTRIHDIWTV